MSDESDSISDERDSVSVECDRLSGETESVSDDTDSLSDEVDSVSVPRVMKATEAGSVAGTSHCVRAEQCPGNLVIYRSWLVWNLCDQWCVWWTDGECREVSAINTEMERDK